MLSLVRNTFLVIALFWFGGEQVIIRNVNDPDNIQATGDCGLGTGNSGTLCDATNTGIAGKGLTTGNLTTLAAGDTTGNGQQIIRRRITGDLCIIHDNVVVRESQIDGKIQVGRACSNADNAATGTLVEDSTITGNGLEGINIAGDPPGGGSTNGIYRRNNICCVENYLTEWTGNNDSVLSNYMHDEAGTPTSHFDGIEGYCWKSGFTVRNNVILQSAITGATSPLNLTPTGCTVTGTLLVEYNLLRSGNGSYVILMDTTQGGQITNGVFNFNRLWRLDSGASYFDLAHSENTANIDGTGNCAVSSLTPTCGTSIPVP